MHWKPSVTPEDVIAHSAKGTHWTKKDHKYIRKEGTRYIYENKIEPKIDPESAEKKHQEAVQRAREKKKEIPGVASIYDDEIKEIEESERAEKKAARDEKINKLIGVKSGDSDAYAKIGKGILTLIDPNLASTVDQYEKAKKKSSSKSTGTIEDRRARGSYGGTIPTNVKPKKEKSTARKIVSAMRPEVGNFLDSVDATTIHAKGSYEEKRDRKKRRGMGGHF